ncbi:DEAD/DEAH box helicase [Planotetraspora mira]|uniref:DEAD/DEAH box helicase n=1 Tax=Planotetraspora mira TaxID=58121 RepID=UPI001EF316A0|nr:SNF2-related protein [Planotetraspora mira]
MLVVHGTWIGGRLALWAEDTSGGTAPAKTPKPSSLNTQPPETPPLNAQSPTPPLKAQSPKTAPHATQARQAETVEPPASTSRTAARAHPFAAAADGLFTELPLWGDVTAAVCAKATTAELTMLLPSSARSPLPSPESGLSVGTRQPRITPWRVPALLVEPAAALDLLDAVDEIAQLPAAAYEPGESLDGAPIPGASLRYLAVVAANVRDMVRRGRILPQLVTEGDGYAARWRPVLTGADGVRFRELAAAMPPVCRAAGDEWPSAHVLGEAFAGLADSAVRQALPERLLGGHRPGTRSPLADRWIVALTGDDAALPGVTALQAEQLSRPLQAWLNQAQRADGPFRVCFRLTEPAEPLTEPPTTEPPATEPPATEDGGPWQVEFALQGSDDPSLYLPAELLWAGETVPGLVGRPEETLLAGLGRAARLYPKIDEALGGTRPSGVLLDMAGAFYFLRHAAPLLQAAGFGVQLPAWAGKSRLGLKMTTRSQRSGPGAASDQGFGLHQLVDFRVDLAIGDETITEEQLAELARLKVPLVRVRGRWVELDDRQLGAALRAVERRRSGEMTVAEVIREVVHGGEDDLPMVVDADGLLGDLLSGEADRRLTPVATPADFHGSLRPYQERGLSWLAFMSGVGLGAVLADDMGLGKTAQTLSLLLEERAGGAEPEPTLLVCPMSLLSNWQKEAARFAPSLEVYLHHGSSRSREEELAERVGRADLVLTTYGTALRDRGMLAGLTWGRIVCDEAQAIKNSAARQAQAVRSLPARTRLALTGTPVENHLAELWSIMEFCNPGLLGSAAAFRSRYQEPIERHGDEAATAALRRATGPFVLRRLKTDKTIISDLPDKLEMKIWCTLTPEQATLYQAVVEDMMGKITGSEGIERRGNVLATMTKLKQVCNHPAHLLKDGSRLAGRSGKLARLEELAEEIVAEGDKALVFTQYAEFGTLLQPYLAAHLDRPVLWLHGGLPKGRRDALVERFQEDDEPMVFLLSLKAAGTGLNLTAANHVVHVDRWWNPAVEDQATDRAFRIGQTKNVQVRKFICVGTLEERIDEMIERKKALAESVVGAGEDWIANLSTEELRELFRLSPEAVS